MKTQATALFLVLVLCGALTGSRVWARDSSGEISHEHPLEPADTSSPRATLFGFIEDGNEAWRIYLWSSRRGTVQTQGTGGRNPGQHYLDLSQVPPC